MTRLYHILLILLVAGALAGQDHVHFAHYKWVNGIFFPSLQEVERRGDIFVSALYREQAFTVTDKGYKSFAMGLETRLFENQKNAFNLGFNFSNDKAGDGALTSNAFSLMPSFNMLLDSKRGGRLSIGAQLSYRERRFGNIDGLIFEQDLLGIPISEFIPFSSNQYLDIGMGLSYGSIINGRSSFQLGISAFHTNDNNTELTKVDKYPLRFDAFLAYNYQINNNLTWRPSIDRYASTIYNALQLQSVFEFNFDKMDEYTFRAGPGWRVNDALQLLLGMDYKSWRFAFAYEYNTSGLQAASGPVAALEFGVQYLFKKPEEKIIPEAPEEIIPIDTIEELSPVVEMLNPKFDSFPEMQITIQEDSIVKLDSMWTLPNFTLDLDPERRTEIIFEIEGHHPDTLIFTPHSYDSNTTTEIALNFKPIELPSPARDTLTIEEPFVELDSIVELNEEIILDRIYYDFDKDNILNVSEEQLGEVLALFERYDSLVIELSSHTDVRGSHEYNIDLSQRRAASARDWLIERGVRPDQIIARGYGETQLWNDCEEGVRCTDDQHRQNRRTVIKILKGPENVKYVIPPKWRNSNR
ncbi:MAG: OmpA family protein [Saprospiraceae bacterium]|nr:OmpA family protein [Saprospiraceae bacterium]